MRFKQFVSHAFNASYYKDVIKSQSCDGKELLSVFGVLTGFVGNDGLARPDGQMLMLASVFSVSHFARF